MRRFASRMLVATALAGGAYGFYRYGLSDEDRKKLTQMVDSARALAVEVWGRVGPILEQMGQGVDYVDLSNREDTRRQWAEMGY